MPLLFAATLFLSATLLFLLQPLAGKMLLPSFGGSSAVWNTCMVFFQALLLAGYSYAHAGPALLGTRRHVVVHLLLFAATVVVLPFAVPAGAAPPPGVDPTLRLLLVLVVAVGLPFFVVSTTAPLVQHWFAATGHRSSRDPYFLYAASNAGSMVGLLAYPFVLEPRLPLHWQTTLWTAGYMVLLVLLLGCGIVVWRAGAANSTGGENAAAADTAPPSWRTRLQWIALAFVPSSLLLGVTTHLSIDVAPMPLLWVLPLAVYLLSFILVFGPLLARGLHLFGRLLPIIVLAQVFFLVARPSVALEQMITANLLTLFVAAMVCHGELARTRPAPRYLTEFYLWMSLGGVLGGAFNALAAPLLFPGTYEYPLALVLLCLLAPQGTPKDDAPKMEPGQTSLKSGPKTAPAVTTAEKRGGPTKRAATRPAPRREVIAPSRSGAPLLLAPVASIAVEALAAVGLVTTLPGSLWLYAGLVLLLSLSGYAKILRLHHARTGASPARLALVLDVAIPACLGFVAVCALGGGTETSLQMTAGLLTLLGLCLYGRPLRLGLGIAALVIVGLGAREKREGVVYRHRNFYGTLRIIGNYTLLHGQTVHGAQAHTLNPEDRKVPLVYYYPTGPAGDVFKTFVKGREGCRIGVIGLGTGSLAAYGEKGQHFTFFEIDPSVIALARDSPYFTYLRDSPAQSDVVAGDARLTLQQQQGPFDLLVIDAFSGDAIPTHLLTREAVQMYREHLAPGGVLLFHTSSLYFELEPLLGSLAEAEGLAGLARRDRATEAEQLAGKVDSAWVVLAAADVDLARLNQLHRWHKVRTRPGLAAWTDDHSSLLSILGISKEAATADP
jgi:hypothetical protein